MNLPDHWSDLDRALFLLDGAEQSIVDEFYAPADPHYHATTWQVPRPDHAASKGIRRVVTQRTLMCGCTEEEVDLIHCPSCLGHVPLDATSCPNCGEEVCAIN